jgi:SAM-dependent methyltransferase
MSRARRSKKGEPLTPEGFLRRLGIRRSSPERVYTEAFDRDACRAGADPFAIDKYGPFSPQASDYRFVTEEIGKRFLSAEYCRLLGLLESFERVEGYPARPQRIADLGGGTGIIGLYLAARDPGCQVAVYDHSPRQVELGRKWAREQHLGNVAYLHTTYQRLAREPKRDDNDDDNDLVLFFYGLHMQVPGPGPAADEQAAMKALARLLSPGGVAVISLTINPHRMGYLFEAIRRAGLGVDWRFTRLLWTTRKGVRPVLDSFIFVRRRMPHLGVDSQADAEAHLRSLPMTRGRDRWDGPLPASWADHFRDGDVLLVAEGLPASPGVERLRLLEKGGRLAVEISWRGGGERYLLRTLASIGDYLGAVHAGWQQGEPVDLARYEVHPRLQRFIAYCRCHPPPSAERR